MIPFAASIVAVDAARRTVEERARDAERRAEVRADRAERRAVRRTERVARASYDEKAGRLPAWALRLARPLH